MGINIHDQGGKNRAFLKLVANLHGLSVAEIENDEKKRRFLNKVMASVCAGAMLLAFNHFVPHKAYFMRSVSGVSENEFDSGHLIDTASRSSITRKLIEYDENGYEKEVRYSDSYNSAVADQNGVYGIRYERDDKGRVVELTLHKDGYAILEAEHDKKGNPIELRYYGLDREPVAVQDGFYAMELEYDKNNNVTEYRLYGEDGELKDGAAIQKNEYNNEGYFLSEAYYNKDNELQMNEDGYAYAKVERDEKQRVTKLCYYDDSDALTNIENGGYAIVKYFYDNVTGNVYRKEYYDKDENPVLVDGEYAAIEWEYEKGKVVAERYYGTNGKLMINPAEGFAIAKAEYDEKGRHIKTAYYGTDEKLIVGTKGYAVVEIEYDEKGKITNIVHYDENNNVMER